MAAGQTRKTVELPVGTIHYREAGPADGPAVVFVHGFLVDGTLWGRVPELLADRGYRTIAPTWPLGAHSPAMNPGADLSPRGVARVVLAFLETLGLDDITLVGNDTGGAICQLALDEDPSRIGRLVLTNCDAFEKFPPFPFGALFRLARSPGLTGAAMRPMRAAALRNGVLGFGPLVRRKLTAEETRPWVEPVITDPDVRRDLAVFARAWTGRELTEIDLASYDKPVLICWAPEDRFFTIALGRRLASTFPHARLVEIADSKTFVALDQPERLAEEIIAFLGE